MFEAFLAVPSPIFDDDGPPRRGRAGPSEGRNLVVRAENPTFSTFFPESFRMVGECVWEFECGQNTLFWAVFRPTALSGLSQVRLGTAEKGSRSRIPAQISPKRPKTVQTA